MDRRSWPWKKKSSDKSAAERAAAAADAAAAALVLAESQTEDSYKKPKYVQISVEQYAHLSGLEDEMLEDEMKMYALDDQINELEEKLSAANTEMTNKDNLVKQHAKVAEEAVSGWEKAEAEAVALKTHLETVTLSKLTAEDRAAHLDGALKECMRQIRNLKEENEQKLQDLAASKNKQCEKMRLELESRISELDQELRRSAAENAAVSRSLQERSNMLVRAGEEKSRADAEIELLRSNVESCEREINSLKYEVHVSAKELEIRTEEKNMSVRSSDAANRQHIEGVKKIAKLEAECQRLRGLVRKKLPGPAALAQMKMEVESLGRDYGDSRVRRSPVKPSSPHLSPATEFSLDHAQKYQKENEFLTERMLAMEEETKMLKEALSDRNSELQAMRSMCAKTASKLQSFETQSQLKSAESNPPSFASMSDDERSCAEKPSHLNLMDDFLEMEKLACLSDETVAAAAAEQKPEPGEEPPLMKLRSRISTLLESVSKESDVGNILEDIKHAIEETRDTSSDVDVCRASDDRRANPEDAGLSAEKATAVAVMSDDLAAAISRIHDFVLLLGKEAMMMMGDHDAFGRRVEEFSAAFHRVVRRDLGLAEFVLDLSLVLSKAGELRFNVLGFKGNGAETNSPDCIDKVALPENKIARKDSAEMYQNGCGSDSEVPDDGNIVTSYESDNAKGEKISPEEFERLRSERESLAAELAKTTESLEAKTSELEEAERLLAEAKSRLASAENSNGLSETQLRCMAESYRSLEARAGELEAELKLLREKAETVETELQDEKKNHQDSLARCRELQEQLKRNEISLQDEVKTNQDKELAAAAEKLAECQETIFLLGKQLKNFRPQSTEFMGSPYNERSQKSEGLNEEEPASSSGVNVHDQADTDTAVSPFVSRLGSESPIDGYNIAPLSPSETDSSLLKSPMNSKNNPRQKSPISGSSSSSSNAATPEKHSRGFSRFFTSKGKNGY